jgi:hypothetical protein
LHALPRRSSAVCFTSDCGCKHQPNGPLVSATKAEMAAISLSAAPLPFSTDHLEMTFQRG